MILQKLLFMDGKEQNFNYTFVSCRAKNITDV